MQSLKSLTFVSLPKQTTDSPILKRRAKLILRLEEQKSLLANPLFFAVDQRWEKTFDGRKEIVERKRKVRRWWREDITGKIYLTLRYGQKLIEFEKGKAAINVQNKEAIAEIIDTLIIGIRNGELDEQLNTMSKARGFRKKAF